MAAARNKRPGKHPRNQLRIIGGQWRGRKVDFPAIEGLRPTPDRVRETLFNWLATTIPGARCLDLFAGSGALGLEALSRGAAYADLIDKSSAAVARLQENLQWLNAPNGQVCRASASEWLQKFSLRKSPPYDIIFLDPPFHQGLVEHCITAIQQHRLLATQGWVYVEMATNEALTNIPAHWRLHRGKNAGQVCYRLFAVDNSQASIS